MSEYTINFGVSLNIMSIVQYYKATCFDINNSIKKTIAITKLNNGNIIIGTHIHKGNTKITIGSGYYLNKTSSVKNALQNAHAHLELYMCLNENYALVVNETGSDLYGAINLEF